MTSGCSWILIGLLIVISVSPCCCSEDVVDWTMLMDDVDGPHRLQSKMPLSESEILVLNAGIRVAFGRSVQVDPDRHLKIRVRHGDRCVVRVVQNDPLYQRVGELRPAEFPCQFGADDVQYSHFGARSSHDDRIRLLLRYDTADDTIIVPVTLLVRVTFERLEVVTKSSTLLVDRLRANLSNPIDHRILQFAYDRKSQVCRVAVLFNNRFRLPRYGELINYHAPEVSDVEDDEDDNDNDDEDDDGHHFVDCDAFVRSNVRYRHTADGKSADRDSVPLVVQLRDQLSDSLLKQEYVQLTVHIKGVAENTPPMVSLNSLLLMDVNQFVMTPLTSDILEATDLETADDDIIFNLTAPLSSGDGFFVSSDDQYLAVTSFTQRELRNLKIAYRPPASDADIRRIFPVGMEVVDSNGLSSEAFTLLITVNPMNSAAPVATRNTGISLFEGQSRRLQSGVNLEISDEDNVDDVTVTVLDGLRHGRLLIVDTEVRRFSPADLDAGLLRYQHDGSDTFSDNVLFRMSDGVNHVEFLFPINIFPVSDEPPVLVVNTGLVLQNADEAAITPFELSAADADSDDDVSIRYVLEEHSSPLYGEIIARRELIALDADDVDEWIFRDGVYERTVTEWTQEDVTEGRIVYRRHFVDGGRPHSQTVMDAVTFRLKDDSEPPNVSQVKQFLVKILPLDDIPPEVYPDTSLHMIVDEMQMKDLTRDLIRFTDSDSDDRFLRYTVTTPLHDLDANSQSSAGQLVTTENPDTEVTSFTQAEINHGRISYRPPPVEMGLARRMVQFGFQVEDEVGNVRPDQVFTIILQPIDNRPPKVFNAGFKVLENGLTRLDTSFLDASDPDTDVHMLAFRVLQLPRHGSLQRRSVPMVVGDRFDRDDLSDGTVLSYVNGGDEANEDSFTVEVTDGVHFVPATVHVTVRPIDDETPRLLGTTTDPIALRVQVSEGGSAVLDSTVFGASDPDTDDEKLMFVVEMKPKHGVIRTVDGRRTERFSQGQVWKRLVEYRHTAGEIGRAPVTDHFNLTLTDMSTEWTAGGNRVGHIRVNVIVNPVNNLAPNVSLTSRIFVLEGQKRVINVDNLKITDSDSVEEDIVCTIMSQPTYGYLELVSPSPGSERSRVGIPITAFLVRDLLSDTLNYVQSIHRGVEPREDRFVVQCSDGTNDSPGRVTVPVIIEPANDEKPQILVGPFTVVEGMQLPLDPSILSATDADQPADALVFTVIRKPKHGRITLLSMDGETEVKMFHLEQIVNISDPEPKPVVMYAHDDSETLSDVFELELSDGNPKHAVRQRIDVVVLPTDDETPRLTINNGIEVDIGGTKVITNRILRAEDVDSNDSDLTYVIRMSPRQGQLRQSNPARNLTNGDEFQQSDIDQNGVEYVHGGRTDGRDLIKLDVTDGVNVLVDQQLYVTVRGLDIVYPDVINRGVTLPEGGRVTLTTDILSTSDLNSDDELLTFVVTQAPNKGHLENSDHPSTPIDSFTQLQLAGHKISYVHTSDDETRTDNFEFEVTDGANSVYRTFRISLVSVDDNRPILYVNEALVVREGGFRPLSPFEMTIEDRDVHRQSAVVAAAPPLTFTVIRVPQHGTVVYNRSRPIDTFTMDELERGLIGYAHDASETLGDTFSVVVTDGTHDTFYVHPRLDEETRRPQTVTVTVLPVDNCAPRMVVNKGATSLGTLSMSTSKDDDDDDDLPIIGFQFSDRVLKCDDRDSDNSRLMYVIGDSPRHGRLVVVGASTNNDNVMNFTQGDLTKRSIRYVLQHGSNATNDLFTFKVVDTGGNELLDQAFRLNWAFVSLEYDSYVVNETEIFLRVNLRRRGYLGETSFVGMNTVDGSAKKGYDFHGSYAKQVQFNPGQSEATFKIRISQDDVYERNEQFQVALDEPIMAVLESPDWAVITITDDEDESVVFFADERREVMEDVGELYIPIRRGGDLSEELIVLCSTISGTATGTIPKTVTSFSDYISRSADQATSAVHFEAQQDVAQCRIVLIDDSLYENEEQFRVSLSVPVGGRIGQHETTTVVIIPDHKDSPSVYFGESSYRVGESDGLLEVTVLRTGSDLSKSAVVTVQSKPSDPPSAKAGKDYVGVNRVLKFAPGVTLKSFRVSILDDVGKPRLDNTKVFELLLRIQSGGALGEPGRVTVTIDDALSDSPEMQFRETDLTMSEDDGQVSAVITRSGDLSHVSNVRCYTRQNTAHVQVDFKERPDTNESIVSFLPGEKEKACTVIVVNDERYEPDEDFRLVLGSAESASARGARVGSRNSTKITINDFSDKPVIKFEKIRLNVLEPKNPLEIGVIAVPVIRLGDKTQNFVVRVHTKDGSAKSGVDYTGCSKELFFSANVSRLTVPIEILSDDDKEHREAFSVHLKPDKNMIADTKDFKAIVYIHEGDSIADVIFPSPPIIVSLRDYDDAGSASESPIPGYPVVCITSCNPKHPDFASTGTLCTREGVNDSLSEFRWRVSVPSRPGSAVTNELQDIQSEVFFSSTKRITLDSIYFNSGSRIQCVSRAVNNDGDPGLEVRSPIVVISESEAGICIPHLAGSYGAEPFTAKLRYTGADDVLHPNLVKLSVVIPHRDGLLPVVSTSPLSNFELTLSRNGALVGNHKCSNLMDVGDMGDTKYGFLTSSIVNSDVVGEVEPYQFNSNLRSEPTLRFYRNLDLDACIWEFESYYGISELVNECGAIIDTDGQVLNSVQSHVSVRIPLYVSYVFHSPVSKGVSTWQHGDLATQLRLTFVYDTSVLWQQGIVSASRESPLQGYLYPTSMRIKHDGRLLVHFRTEARFTGHFLHSHPGSNATSVVISAEHPDLAFNLELVRSEATFSQPSQEWNFSSDFSIRDYSGTYLIKLIPCTVTENTVAMTESPVPFTCEPRELIDFEMRIRFQQVSDPVAARYSLDTRFHLMQSRDLWHSDGYKMLQEDTDVSFEPGETIYGRIMVDPVQNLGTALQVTIEKCFVCTGIDGYIPKYDPSRSEYGCISNSPNLLFSFKLIDAKAPSTVQREFRDVPFNAILASEDETVEEVQQQGSDCFRLDSSPLFQVSHERQWFVHCVYTIRSEGSRLGKRSSRRKRSIEDPSNLLDGVGDDGRGTNMHGIILAHDRGSRTATAIRVPQHGRSDANDSVSRSATPKEHVFFWVLFSTLLTVSFVALLIVWTTMKHQRRSSECEQRRRSQSGANDVDRSKNVDGQSSTVTTVTDVMTTTAATCKYVVSTQYDDSDNTEV